MQLKLFIVNDLTLMWKLYGQMILERKRREKVTKSLLIY
jgi:hypothetical protein